MIFRLAEPETADGGTPGWIVADGEITADSAKSFRDFLTTNKAHLDARSVVLLNSLGGSLLGGVTLGEVIREFGLGTRIGRSIPGPPHQGNYVTETESPGVCLSACAFAFLGGKSRIASDRTLGVHQHYSEDALREPAAKQFTAGDLSAQQIIAGILAEYVVRMGVDARFLTRAAMTAPRSMYLFTTKEMEEFSITLNDLEFSPWTFEPYKSGLIAVSKTLNKEYIATLFCRSDKALRILINRPFYGDEKDVETVLKGASVSLFGVDIPTDNIKGKAAHGRVTLEFKLPSQLAAGNVERNSGMGASGPARQIFYYDLPDKDFGTFARLASRNCI
ncbi:MAG: hypothetical protein WCC90_12330 [Methylocella sp.]